MAGSPIRYKMANKIHATKVPMVEFEFESTVYKFVYNLATMNHIAQLAREDRLPTSEDVWNEEHIRTLIECTGLTHHPDENWDYLFDNCTPGDLVHLSTELSNMIGQENERAFGASSEGEVTTEPIKPPAKSRRKASTG